jgi:Uncharacterised nucleotidyltransferase
MPEVLSNEYRLLLACARRDLSQKDFANAQSAITAGIDWDLLTRHSRKHGLSCLLWHHLRDHFPQTMLNKHDEKQMFFKNAARNLYLSATLVRIFDALHTAGIRALAYKGPTLAAALYGDIALREMSDLDILIDLASFSAAREVLLNLGYRDQFQHSRKQEEAGLRSECEFEFFSSDGNVVVDLHWGITPRHLASLFNFDELWDRRCTVSLGQEPVPTFSAEDTTLVLAVHGGKHLWQQLSWLVDFAETLHGDLDWRVLRSRARHAHAERMLWLGLALAKEVLGSTLPLEFEDGIKNDLITLPAAADIIRALFEESDSIESNRRRWLTTLRLADTRWDGLRCAARFALGSGPREWQAIRLPDFLFGFYHFLRVATLFRTVPSLFCSGRRARRNRGDSRAKP